MIQRFTLYTVFALALCWPPSAHAQFANHTGNVAGTVGGACTSSSNDYAWPDTNGDILKCVSNVWTLVTQPATAAGSTGYVQFDNAGALAASANLFWDNTNFRLGIGTAVPGSALSVSGAAVIGSYSASGTTGPSNGLIVSGNVGIGTSNPGALFTVGNNAFEINSSGVVTTTNGVTLADVVQIATNTILGNSTSGTANITALSIGGCSSASSALIWTTNTGFGCNSSITAAAATDVATIATSTSSTFFPLFVASSSNGNQVVNLNANFTINPSTGALGIIGPLTSTQASIGTTSTNGLVLTNTTAATSTVNQWSPRVHWTGQGWKTNATAGTQAVDMIEELQPVTGAASPSGNLTWSSSINGGAYSPLLTLTTGGSVGIGTTAPGFNLDVQASSGTATLRLKNTGGGSQIAIDRSSTASNAQFFFSTAGSADFTFGTGVGGAGVSDFGILDSSTAANSITIKQSSGFVGIGTTTPGATLSVNGGAVVGSYGASGTAAPSNGLIVSGNVGIGTTSPQSLFHVRVGTDQNLWVHTPATVSTGAELATVNDAVSALEPMELRASLFDFTGGNVGIGTTVPGTKLDVNGAVTMRGMSAPSVSASGQSIIYFDSAANVLKISQNGAAYTPISGPCRVCAFECTVGGTYGCVTTAWVCSAYSSGNVQQNTASGGSITVPYEIGIQCQ